MSDSDEEGPVMMLAAAGGLEEEMEAGDGDGAPPAASTLTGTRASDSVIETGRSPHS